MRISTPLFFQRGLAAMQDSQTDLLHTQQQLATGKRILSPADDPAGAGRILDLKQALALNTQYKANADQAQNRLAQEESAIAHITDVLQRVRELALQGANASQTNSDRSAIALEVKQRLDEVLAIANTRDANGDFLFAGTMVATQPFARKVGGGFSYAGDQGTRSLQLAPATRVRIGDAGDEVFQQIRDGNGVFSTAADSANNGSGVIGAGSVSDPTLYTGDSYRIQFASATSFDVLDVTTATTIASGVSYSDGAAISNIPGVSVGINGSPTAGDRFTVKPSVNRDMFTTVQGLVDGLAISGTSAANALRSGRIGEALSNLDRSIEKMNLVRARIGARLNTIDSEVSANADFDLFLRKNLSATSDVDIAEAISRLTQGANSLQAAQQSFAKIQNLSLFQFL